MRLGSTFLIVVGGLLVLFGGGCALMAFESAGFRSIALIIAAVAIIAGVLMVRGGLK